MIYVTVKTEESGRILSFEMTGHANYADNGQDLVCAGASAVSFGAVNAIEALTGIIPQVDLGGGDGYLHVDLPKLDDGKKDEQIQLIVRSMIVSLQTIELDYSDYIDIIIE